MEKRNAQIALMAALTTILSYLLLFLFCRVAGLRSEINLDLNDTLRIEILHADGRYEEKARTDSLALEQGERLRFFMPIPEELPDERLTICFVNYNCITTISLEGKVLYSYGKDAFARGVQIGNVYHHVRIPEEARGKELLIEYYQQQRRQTSHNTTFKVVPEDKAMSSMLEGRETEFLLILTILVVSILALIISLLARFVGSGLSGGIWLSLFCATIAAWYLGAHDMFYYLSANERFSEMVEYYTIFLAPVFMLLYLYGKRQRSEEEAESKGVRIVRRIFGILAGVSVGYFVVATILHHAHIAYYTDLLPGVHVLIGAAFVALIANIIVGRKTRLDDEAILEYGSFAAMVLTIYRIIGMNVSRYTFFSGTALKLIDYDTAGLALIVFVATIFVSYAVRLLTRYREQTERRELERLAYVDLLTGIPNRSYCVREMGSLQEESEKGYGVAFFDADGLKKANDLHGHETGDQLIMGIASCIREAYREESCEGFYGRWGGDEFIAFFRNRDEMHAFRRAFERILAEAAKNSKLPIPLKVSVGYYEAEQGEDPTQAINRADEEMYRRKMASREAAQGKGDRHAPG